jgi:hypothetical protein
LHVSGAEEQSTRQYRDGGDEAGEQHSAERRHQHRGEDVETCVGPTPDSLGLEPRDAFPDHEVKQVNQRPQRTQVSAEPTREHQPDHQNGRHANQGHVPAAGRDGRGKTHERIDPKKGFHGQPLFGQQHLAGERHGVRPGDAEKQIQVEQEANRLQRTANWRRLPRGAELPESRIEDLVPAGALPGPLRGAEQVKRPVRRVVGHH